jgi:type II secretion system protein G
MVNKRNGFTLLELIIVAAIIALIATATIAVLNPFGQFQKARDTRVKSDLSQVQKALESYYQDNNSYPLRATQCTYVISGNNGDGNDCIEWGRSWQPYMNVIPQDPTTANRYVYYVSSNRQSYYIYANLGRGAADPNSCNSGAACTSLSANGIASNACGGTCNFGVTSPNVTP